MNNSRFIQLIGVLLVVSSFTAFAGGQSEEEADRGRNNASDMRQSPMLAERVATGELPPLEERLPAEPAVVSVSESIGTYGGTLRLVSNEQGRLGDGRNGITVGSLTKAATDTTTVVPHLAESFEWEDDTTLVFRLREGTKWSDGEPVTTENVRFWWEDYQNNEDLMPSGPSVDYITPSGVMELEIVDEYTFKMQFQDPKPQILESLAMHSEYMEEFPIMPSHYLSDYHEDYADKNELEKLMTDRGVDDWTQLFNSRMVSYWDARSEETLGAPSLHSYVLSQVGANYFRLERNPYYWRTDEEGNQLPYIDEVDIQVVGQELYHGQVASGEADFAARRTNLKNLALYVSGEERGNYETRLWNAVGDGDYIVLLGHTTSNPVNRELIRNDRFRKALSIAIDREDFNETINSGLAIEQQNTLLPSSRFYKEEYAQSWAEYDPERANEMLDELGLEWDSNEEYRLGPDGERITFYLEEGGERPIEAAELLAQYWQEVGIDMDIRGVDRDLFHDHMANNQLDVHITKFGRMDGAFITKPTHFLPVEPRGTDAWAPSWGRWRVNEYEGGTYEEDVERPPEEIISLIETWEELKFETDEQEQKRLADRILSSQAENLWTIGVTVGGAKPVIVSNDLGNVLGEDEGTYTYDFLQYAQYANADTWFLRE